MRTSLRRPLVPALVATALVAAAALGRADEKAAARKPDKADNRTEGVIIKVEDAGSKDAKGARRLTIKTDAVWRDYARDTADVKPKGDPKKAAEKGKQSVATKGQPEGSGDDVIVVVTTDTKVEERFRADDDATGLGATTPDGAREREKDPQDKTATKSPQGSDAKAPKITCDDLKTGLYVAVEYAGGDRHNAKCVTVLRPVLSTHTSADVPTETQKKGK